MLFRRRLVHTGIGADDDQIADLNQPCRRAVNADFAGSCFALDGVCRKARAVGDVQDIDLFMGEYARGLQQGIVNGDRALIMQVGAGDGGAVNFAFEHCQYHALTS